MAESTANDSRHAPVCAVSLDASRTILDVNRAAEEILGRRRDELVGRPIDCVFPAADRSEFDEDLESLLACKQQAPDQPAYLTARDSQGKLIPVEALPILFDSISDDPVTLAFRDIRSQFAVLEESRRLSQALHCAGDAILITDAQARILQVNPAFTEITGYSAIDAVGDTPAILKSGHHPPEFYEAMWARLLDGKKWSGRLVNRRKNGELFHASVAISSIRGSRGSVVGYISVQADVTKDIIQERNLAEQAKFSSLLAQVGLALTAKDDLDTMLDLCANAILRGLDVEGVLIWTREKGSEALNLAAAAGVETVSESYRRVLPDDSPFGVVAREQRAHYHYSREEPQAIAEDGTSFSGSVALPLVVENALVGMLGLLSQEPLGQTVLGTLDSITDAISVGIHRKQSVAELTEAYQEISQILSSISAVLIRLDRDGIVTRWNAEAERVFEIRSEEIVGRCLRETVPSVDWAALADLIRLCRKLGQPVRSDEIRFTRKDGSDGRLSATARVIASSGDPEDADVLLLFTDSTDLYLLQSQLAQAHRLEAVGQLAAGVAHEINTPTQYVGDNTRFVRDTMDDVSEYIRDVEQLLAELAGEDGAERMKEKLRELRETHDIEFLLEETPKALDQSLEGIAHVSKIVQSMKDFSHPGGTQKDLVDVNRAIESTITVSRNEWKYSSDLETDLAPDLPPVSCFGGEFNQVLLNLIVNAAHAIQGRVGETGEKGKIRISTRHRDGDVEISISDTGGGVPEHVRNRIFDPFFTTKEVGKGTGQGLAIVHNSIVSKLGGQVTFDTVDGEGTTFFVRIPLAEETIAEPVS